MPEEGNYVLGICAPSKYETEHVSQGDYIGITIPGTKIHLTSYCLLRFAGILFQRQYLQFSCCGGHRDHGTGLWADCTLIHHQVLCWKRLPQHICIWLPDTDVLILLIALVSWGQPGDHTHLKLLTGNGIKYHRVDVVERVRVVGRHKCRGLTGLHNLSNVDWTRTFVDITKTTWLGAYMKFYDDNSVTNCFIHLGDNPNPF